MSTSPYADLSRRERQVMEALLQHQEASAEDLRAALADAEVGDSAVSNSAVRAALRVLEEKGRVVRRRDGRRYLYRPAGAPEQARLSALQHVKRTLFGGSVGQTVAALLSDSRGELTEGELDEISALIQEARRETRS